MDEPVSTHGRLVVRSLGFVWVGLPGRFESKRDNGSFLSLVWTLVQRPVWAAILHSFWLARPSSPNLSRQP